MERKRNVVTATITERLVDPRPAPTEPQLGVNGKAVLELVNVNKQYGQTTAVKNVSLTVNRGDVLALLGPNGAGKSTSIDIALGLVKPNSGQARLFGGAPREAVRRGLIGVVQQNDALLGDFTVQSLLSIVAQTHAQPRAVADVLAVTGIEHLAKRLVRKCSGGEKQRIRLALALLSDPQLLVLDEPTTGMDVRLRQEFWQFIGDEVARGRSVIFATHYLAEAQDYAARTAIIKAGTIIADDTTERLREQYAHYTLEVLRDGPTQEIRQRLEQANPSWQVSIQAVNETRQSDTSGFISKASAGSTVHRLRVCGVQLDEAARIVLADPKTHHLTITKASLENAYLRLVNTDDNPSTSNLNNLRSHLAEGGADPREGA